MSSRLNFWSGSLLLVVGAGACSSEKFREADSSGGATAADGTGADGIGADGTGADGTGADGTGADGTGADDATAGAGTGSAGTTDSIPAESADPEPPMGGSAEGADDGTSSTDGDAGSSEDDPDFKSCASGTTTARLTPANLIFVVDQSGSMNCNAPEAADNLRCEAVRQNPDAPSKWDITSDALNAALNELSELPNIKAAITAFPLPDPDNPGDSCVEGSAPQVTLEVLDAAHLDVIQGFLGAAEPSGETPLAGTTILSYAFLAEQLRAGEIDGNSFLVLLTDGTETCKPAEITKLLEQDVPAARDFNIRTFVIGAPGSEDARGMLSRLAFEGGTATTDDCDHSGDNDAAMVCHFDMTQSEDFSQDLADVLRDISRDEELVCRFDVPENTSGGGVDLDEVNVIFKPMGGGDVEVLNDPDSDCDDGAEGWQYTSDSTQIQLCGEICEMVRDGGDIEVVLGCPSRKVVR